MIKAHDLREYCNKRSNSVVPCRRGCKYVGVCDVIFRPKKEDKSNKCLVLYKLPCELNIDEINKLIMIYEEENKND